MADPVSKPVGGAGGAARVGGADGPSGGPRRASPEAVRGAMDRATPGAVRAEGQRVGGPESGFEAPPGVREGIAGAAVAGRSYGAIDPTNGRGINDARYTPKVLEQARPDRLTLRPDHHGFSPLVDNAAREAQSFAFRGNDGRMHAGVEVPGALRGQPGTFEYIVKPNGQDINHRLFKPEGQAPTIPRDAIVPGTNALRALGRGAVVAGAVMDVAEIATSPTPVRTAVEKAGGWGGSLAAGSLAAQAATPLLAGGPWGAAGYGAVVLGAGIAGYFGGEAATRAALGWLGF